MSVMHDHTRRIICRVLFLALAFLPTVAVFGWAMSYHWPGARGRLESDLFRELGLQVSVEDVSYPQPGVTVYQGLKLADAEFGTPMANIDQLQVVSSAEGLTLLAGQVNVTEFGGPVFWEWIQENLRVVEPQLWQFHAEHIRVTSGGKPHPLADFRVRNNPALGGSSAIVLFRTRTGDDAGEDIQIKLARQRQANPPSIAWELRTGANELPVSLIRIVLPQIVKFGADARYRGTLMVSRGDAPLHSLNESMWGCDFNGVMEQVNLGTLCSELLPGSLEGTARIEIEHAQVRSGRLNSASALLTGGTGRISGLLVLAAAAALELETKAPATEQFGASMQTFERFGLAVGINSRGVVLRGVCENSVPGTIVGTMNGPLLRTQEPDHALQPIAGLLQIVAPNSPAISPITPEALRLAHVLPLTAQDTNHP
jgi:hypothetical protein